jgi:predicted metalloprotease
VKWTPGTENDDVIDERGDSGGGGGGGGFGAMHLTGGGLATVVVIVVVARLFGVDVSGLFSHSNAPVATRRPDQAHPPSGPDPDRELVAFVKFAMKDIQHVFETRFQAEGKPYRHAKLVLFTSAIDTGCGRSSSAIGPFYCPADEHAYIDLSFYRELRQRFGAPGNFAQAYVLAHEIGHHVQALMGTEGQMRQMQRSNPGSANELSVRLELQADCYAGVWGHEANKSGRAAAGGVELDPGDIDAALHAAAAIGDDRLQKLGTGRVMPEKFTHGSSEQRVTWFKRGFDSGDPAMCNTFQ